MLNPKCSFGVGMFWEMAAIPMLISMKRRNDFAIDIINEL
jgi:hypothetical protein